MGSGSHFELIFLLLIVRSIKDAITKMPLTDEIVHLVVGLVWGGLYGFELSLFSQKYRRGVLLCKLSVKEI